MSPSDPNRSTCGLQAFIGTNPENAADFRIGRAPIRMLGEFGNNRSQDRRQDDSWPKVKLGELIRLQDNSVASTQLTEINLAGVYSFGRGLLAARR
jgi:hypothetical protein